MTTGGLNTLFRLEASTTPILKEILKVGQNAVKSQHLVFKPYNEKKSQHAIVQLDITKKVIEKTTH